MVLHWLLIQPICDPATQPLDKIPFLFQTMTFVPVIQLVVNVAILVLAIYQKPHKMGVGLAILFSGIPVYWLGVMWEKKPAVFVELVGELT